MRPTYLPIARPDRLRMILANTKHSQIFRQAAQTVLNSGGKP